MSPTRIPLPGSVPCSCHSSTSSPSSKIAILTPKSSSFAALYTISVSKPPVMSATWSPGWYESRSAEFQPPRVPVSTSSSPSSTLRSIDASNTSSKSPSSSSSALSPARSSALSEVAAAAPPSRRADFPSRASSLPFPYANHAPPVSTLFSLTLISVTMDIDT